MAGAGGGFLEGKGNMENGSIQVLLVDDEEGFRQAIARRLDRRGLAVRQAEGGEGALAILAESAVDVVVSDVRMPGMDGLELLDRIKQGYPEIEVILLTGHACADDGVAGIKSGAFDYLCKPIEIDHLTEKIRQARDKIQRREEKRREAEYRRRMEEQMIATERLASLGTLATGVAHEINNPLAIIKEAAGWMTLILNKPEMEGAPRRADLQNAAGKIEDAVERARRITHQLLGMVRKSEGADMTDVSLDALLAESIALIYKEALNRDIEITRWVDEAVRSIHTDPYQLRQVFINLITNAVHAVGKNGRVIVTAQPEGDRVAITVKDTGEGIPKEHLERIFEPFFSTKAPGKGTGLGLFVTRNIVEKLGGRISVESRVGQGAAFIIELPRKKTKT